MRQPVATPVPPTQAEWDQMLKGIGEQLIPSQQSTAPQPENDLHPKPAELAQKLRIVEIRLNEIELTIKQILGHVTGKGNLNVK